MKKSEILKNQKTIDLIKTILCLEDSSEAKKFFVDLLSQRELIELGNRWYVARLLHQGMSYVQIVQDTGLSSTTIARISKALTKGEGGYLAALKKMEKELGKDSSRCGKKLPALSLKKKRG
jgi:TrpR-related protein YerC/YecD